MRPRDRGYNSHIPILITTEAVARKFNLTGMKVREGNVDFWLTECKKGLGFDRDLGKFVLKDYKFAMDKQESQESSESLFGYYDLD